MSNVIHIQSPAFSVSALSSFTDVFVIRPQKRNQTVSQLLADLDLM